MLRLSEMLLGRTGHVLLLLLAWRRSHQIAHIVLKLILHLVGHRRYVALGDGHRVEVGVLDGGIILEHHGRTLTN